VTSLHEDILAAAEDIVPSLAAHAAASEKSRSLAPESVLAMERAGLWRLLTPKRWGGLEADFRTQVAASAILTKGDPAAGWLLVAEVATPGVRYGGLILVSAGPFCALAVFWILCGSLLSQAAGPAGMALINCVGIAGGSAITPFVVGVLKDWSGSFAPGVLFVAATLLLTIALVTLVAAHQRATAVALEAS